MVGFQLVKEVRSRCDRSDMLLPLSSLLPDIIHLTTQAFPITLFTIGWLVRTLLF